MESFSKSQKGRETDRTLGTAAVAIAFYLHTGSKLAIGPSPHLLPAKTPTRPSCWRFGAQRDKVPSCPASDSDTLHPTVGKDSKALLLTLESKVGSATAVLVVADSSHALLVGDVGTDWQAPNRKIPSVECRVMA